MFLRLGELYIAIRHITTILFEDGGKTKIWLTDTPPDIPIECEGKDTETVREFLKIRNNAGLLAQ